MQSPSEPIGSGIGHVFTLLEAMSRRWSAGVSAGCLNRWSRDGELLERVELPVPNPTMPCFAGEDMKTVYVTSLTRTPHEHAGAMVRLRLPVAGVPVAQFPL